MGAWSVRPSIRLSQPGGKRLTCFLAKGIHHWDRAAVGRKSKLLIEGGVVKASSGGVFASGSVVDSLQACPVDRRKAHRTGFTTGVNLAARKGVCPQPTTGIPNGDDLRMSGRVIGRGHPVPSPPDNFAVPHDDGPERPALASLHLLQGKPNRFTKEILIHGFSVEERRLDVQGSAAEGRKCRKHCCLGLRPTNLRRNAVS